MLKIGTIYQPSQLKGLVANNDIPKVESLFRSRKLPLTFQFAVEPMELFADQAKEVIDSYRKYKVDTTKIDKIIGRLNGKQTIFPIFVEYGDPNLFVIEGKHRLAAHLILKNPTVPVLYIC